MAKKVVPNIPFVLTIVALVLQAIALVAIAFEIGWLDWYKDFQDFLPIPNWVMFEWPVLLGILGFAIFNAYAKIKYKANDHHVDNFQLYMGAIFLFVPWHTVTGVLYITSWIIRKLRA